MKKFFIVLGSIFLALIVLGGIGVAIIATRGAVAVEAGVSPARAKITADTAAANIA